jgi:hypothetical protein
LAIIGSTPDWRLVRNGNNFFLQNQSSIFNDELRLITDVTQKWFKWNSDTLVRKIFEKNLTVLN